MQYRSFKKTLTVFTLFFFLATPISVFAQGLTSAQVQQLIQLQALQRTGALTAQDAQLLQTLTLLQQQQYPQQFGQQQGFGQGAGNALGQLGFLSLLGGQGGLGGNNQLLTGAALGGLMGGGGFGGGGGGGGGPVGMVGQALTLAGALSGNMGLIIGGMITSMIGGFVGGGMGATPQRGTPDEQYVAQGQAGPYGSGSSSPYYPTPSPPAGSGQSTASTCKESIFIVKDTTATPNITKPYPNTKTINQSDCVLAINSDSASHKIQAKKQGSNTIITEQAIDREKSHAFRFPDKNTYTLCVDGNASACTTVTVQ